MKNVLSRAAAALACGLAIAAIAGCAPSALAESAATTAPARPAADWPRTVEVGGAAVEIAAPPERIVALSTETGDLALQLVGPERVAAVASGSVTEGTGNAIEEAREVETVLAPGTAPDPEQILSLDPDLVILTGRHEGEAAAAELLQASGVPSLAFAAADFQTFDAVLDSISVLGDALGAEDEAARITDRMAAERDEIASAVASADRAPEVLLLMARGGQLMIQPASTLMADLVRTAGGEPVGAGDSARPADPEQVAVLDPEAIIVEDFRGAGLEPFRPLLDSPAVAEVTAIRESEVHAVSGAIATGAAGSRAAEGLAEIARILHPGAF
ncbi:ABC transporter substrate-binding protein [Microbacterium sp. JZ70]